LACCQPCHDWPPSKSGQVAVKLVAKSLIAFGWLSRSMAKSCGVKFSWLSLLENTCGGLLER
jgi:hypothetical protein